MGQMENKPTETVKIPFKEQVKLIAQYSGQPVELLGTGIPLKGIVKAIDFENGSVKIVGDPHKASYVVIEAHCSMCIHVKPLVRISKLHAVKLTEIFNCSSSNVEVRFVVNDHNPKGFAQVYYTYMESTETELQEKIMLNLGSDGDISICSGNSYFENIQQALDLLREWGYALPYKNWSVKELEEFGIYKLID